MSAPEEELVRLRELCPAGELLTEGGQIIALLPNLQFWNGGKRMIRDGVLWPWDRDGYSSRLFLSEPVTAVEAKNWNTYSMLGRTWHACSWQGVPNTLPWIEILANHLRAFK